MKKSIILFLLITINSYSQFYGPDINGFFTLPDIRIGATSSNLLEDNIRKTIGARLSLSNMDGIYAVMGADTKLVISADYSHGKGDAANLLSLSFSPLISTDTTGKVQFALGPGFVLILPSGIHIDDKKLIKSAITVILQAELTLLLGADEQIAVNIGGQLDLLDTLDNLGSSDINGNQYLSPEDLRLQEALQRAQWTNQSGLRVSVTVPLN